jgi:hypothetical protein
MKDMFSVAAKVIMLVVCVDREAKKVCESDMFLVAEVLSPHVSE